MEFKIKTLHDYNGSPFQNCEIKLLSDKKILLNIFGTDNIPIDIYKDDIIDIKTQKGCFSSFMGFGSFSGKSEITLNLNSLKKRYQLDVKKKEALIDFKKNINNSHELFNCLDLKQKFINVVLNKESLDNLVGEYFYKKVLSVVKIEKSYENRYTCVIDFHQKHYTPTTFVLFTKESSVRCKLSNLLNLGVINETDFEKYIKKEGEMFK